MWLEEREGMRSQRKNERKEGEVGRDAVGGRRRGLRDGRVDGSHKCCAPAEKPQLVHTSSSRRNFHVTRAESTQNEL